MFLRARLCGLKVRASPALLCSRCGAGRSQPWASWRTPQSTLRWNTTFLSVSFPTLTPLHSLPSSCLGESNKSAVGWCGVAWRGVAQRRGAGRLAPTEPSQPAGLQGCFQEVYGTFPGHSLTHALRGSSTIDHTLGRLGRVPIPIGRIVRKELPALLTRSDRASGPEPMPGGTELVAYLQSRSVGKEVLMCSLSCEIISHSHCRLRVPLLSARALRRRCFTIRPAPIRRDSRAARLSIRVEGLCPGVSRSQRLWCTKQFLDQLYSGQWILLKSVAQCTEVCRV